MSGRRVAVVGGGYSGTLLSLHLLERGVQVTLIERADRLARGVAYSTRHADHLLNVRAAGMSALPDSPDHFARWTEAEGLGDGTTFVQRREYGRYLERLIGECRLDVVRAEADDIAPDGTVRCANGEVITADAVVLALGNLPSETPRAIGAAGLAPGAYIGDPWAEDLAAGLGEDDTVLLLGTGLTAIDAALMLDSAGFRGRILALSRRGLLPRAHADAAQSAEPLAEAPDACGSRLLALVRARAQAIGWRAAVDSLRPVTQALWASASPDERRRFLRHLRPWWDVHRHRIAPSIAARIEGLIADRRLQVAAGKIGEVLRDRDGALLRWRARGEDEAQRLPVRRIVNCTGPQADISRAGEPLLDALLAAGRIRSDPLRIGVDVNASSRVVAADGCPSETLYAVGPITRGAFWEIVAVPDIRHQVKAVAERLA